MNDRRVVVVIEQDEEVRALLRATLGDAGFEVHFAATGESGVELVRAKQPDTVTLDVVLPDMDGYEVARRIREFSHTYIIILTARSDLRATIKGFDAGADDYIVKPIRPRELRARVDGMLRRPRRLGTGAPVGTAAGGTAPPSRRRLRPVTAMAGSLGRLRPRRERQVRVTSTTACGSTAQRVPPASAAGPWPSPGPSSICCASCWKGAPAWSPRRNWPGCWGWYSRKPRNPGQQLPSPATPDESSRPTWATCGAS